MPRRESGRQTLVSDTHILPKVLSAFWRGTGLIDKVLLLLPPDFYLWNSLCTHDALLIFPNNLRAALDAAGESRPQGVATVFYIDGTFIQTQAVDNRLFCFEA